MKKFQQRIRLILLSAMISIITLLLLVAFRDPVVNKGYTITGSINGFTSGMVYLTYEYNFKQHTDSAKVVDGQFQLTGRLPEPLLCTLRVSTSKQIRIFFAENTNMQFKANLDKLFDGQLSGSPENETWKTYKTLLQDVIGAKVTDMRKRAKAIAQQNNAGEPQEAAGKLSASEIREIDDYRDSVLTGFIKAQRTRIATACAVYQRYIAYTNYAKAAQFYAMLDKAPQRSFYGRRILQNIGADSSTAIGKQAPAFSLPDTTGRQVAIDTYKGKYLLVDFWASWCGPCRKEHPHLADLYRQYHPKGWEVVSVTVDSDQTAWKTAIKYDGLLWTQVTDGSGGPVSDLYGVKSVPRNVLIDPSGKIIAKNLRGEALDEILKTLFP